jgi:Matrixin
MERRQESWPLRRLRRAGVALAVLATLATGGVLAAGIAPAGAYVIQGHAWPGHVIRYHNAFPADAAAVAAAVHDWNTSGADVRFVSAPTSQADVTIAEMPSNFLDQTAGADNSDLLGYASVGMVPRSAVVVSPSGNVRDHGAHIWLVRIGSRDASGVKVSLGTMQRVAAHEFGHVLGLGHEHHVCAVMQPALNEGCGVGHPWIGLCTDPLQPDDIRGAVALYGGREPRGGKRLCTLSPPPPAPQSASAAAPAGSYNVTLRWRNPSGITLPAGAFDPYSLAGRPTIAAYEVDGSRHGCPAPQHDLIERWPARAGAAMKTSIGLGPGSWCLRVRIGDAFNRWGPAATLHVTVPAAP